METTPNVHQDMDGKRIGGIYTQWNIIQLKKRNPAICNNMGELGAHYVKGRKPVTQGPTLNDSSYIRYLN